MGTPVFSHAGIVCTGETYKSVVKLTFAKGARSKIPQPLQLQPRRQHPPRHRHPRRRKDQRSGLKDLIRAAVELNLTVAPSKSKPKSKPKKQL